MRWRPKVEREHLAITTDADVEDSYDFQVLVKTLTGKIINFDMKTSDTIYDVKAKVQGKINIPAD